MKILLVEDERLVLDAFRLVLEDDRHVVTVAENGQQALDWLARPGQAFDLILLDLMLPVLDGWGVLACRTGTAWASVPVIAFTAAGESVLRDLPPGVGVFQKPGDVDQLLAAVRRVSQTKG